MSDTALQRAIMQALADNSLVHAEETAEPVIDGEVVLHGTVGGIMQPDEAALTVRALAGIRHIDNNLRVHFLDSDRPNCAGRRRRSPSACPASGTCATNSSPRADA